MASASSSLIKGVLVLLFIGAVFLGLNFMLEEVPETAPESVVQTPGATSPGDDDPAVAEARELGQDIGRKVGEEIGRRVGETLVANLEAGGFPETAAEETLVASADGVQTPETDEQEPSVAAEPVPEPAPVSQTTSVDEVDEEEVSTAEETVMADAGDETSSTAMDETEGAGSLDDEFVADASDDQSAPDTSVSSADSEPAMPAPDPDPVYPIVEQTSPGIPIETVHTQPGTAEDDPKGMIPNPPPKKQTVATQPPSPAPKPKPTAKSRGYANWWSDSVNGNGLRIVHVGQSMNAEGQKGISIITSHALAQGQNIDSLVQVHDGDQSVAGSWFIAPHRKSLFLHTDPGSYQLSFDPALKAAGGQSLGMELSGPVTIR